MSDALAGLPVQTDPNLLVGFDAADDGAAYKLTDGIAVISTVDFITPPVDDPYWFGQIAAANSLSDIYAMGGRPQTALNLVMFPSKQLDVGVLRDILRGGHDKVVEAGACVVGGHSVEDAEPKYGLAVTGVADPDELLLNSGARPGDVLFLTKPLGTGVLFNAIRAGRMTFEQIQDETLPLIASLNATALEAARRYDVSACTDVTGFGLAGHLLEMARGGSSQFVVSFDDLPFYEGAREMYEQDVTTGSNAANRDVVGDTLVLRRELSDAERELLFDPQTSGGLLLAIAPGDAEGFESRLIEAGLECATRIGEVREGPAGIVVW